MLNSLLGMRLPFSISKRIREKVRPSQRGIYAVCCIHFLGNQCTIIKSHSFTVFSASHPVYNSVNVTVSAESHFIIIIIIITIYTPPFLVLWLSSKAVHNRQDYPKHINVVKRTMERNKSTAGSSKRCPAIAPFPAVLPCTVLKTFLREALFLFKMAPGCHCEGPKFPHFHWPPWFPSPSHPRQLLAWFLFFNT